MPPSERLLNSFTHDTLGKVVCSQSLPSRDRQGAVSPPQESGPATSLRPTQGDHPPARGFQPSGPRIVRLHLS